jgi:hypothetical protein
MRLNRLVAATLIAAIICVPLWAQEKATTKEPTKATFSTMLKIGALWPLGTELQDYFGARYPIGLETRVRSARGVGGSLSFEIWWQSRQGNVSTLIPISIGTTYGAPILNGALIPFGGLFASYTFATLYFFGSNSTNPVRAYGSGLSGGLVLGAEVPIIEGFGTIAELKVSLGGIPMYFDDNVGNITKGEHTITTSGLGINFGITMGMTKGCGGCLSGGL